MFKNFSAEAAQILKIKNKGKSFGAPRGVLTRTEKPVKRIFPTVIRGHMHSSESLGRFQNTWKFVQQIHFKI